MTVNIFRVCPHIVVLYLALSLAGCATAVTAKLPPEEPAMHTMSEFSDDEKVVDIADPWEGFNRSMYNFNYHFDKYLFLPVVSGYEFITPIFIQKGISNFFSNLGEVRTLYNSIFQLKGKKSLTTFGRFLTNTTIGVGGLFDPATALGLKKQSADFGQSLGYWGVGSGPYLVVPVLGPNTLRSTGGFAVDAGIRFAAIDASDPFKNIDNGSDILTGISALEGIDLRHKEKFRYYESGYPFEYELVRFLYYKKGELLLMK
jgi:phospholipid-binding lipoprotein MlaA